MASTAPLQYPKQSIPQGLRRDLPLDGSGKVNRAAAKALAESLKTAPQAAFPKPAPAKPVLQAAPVSMALPKLAFGAARWRQYFGDVGAEPPIPPGILQALKTPCPFWPGKETHFFLTLIPSTVDGKPFCLDLLGELIQYPKGGGHATKYEYYLDNLKAAHGGTSPLKSYWVLLSRDVIEGTLSKSYADQCKVLEAKRQGLPYEVPGLLEAATSLLMEHVQTGRRWFGREPWTFTRCREQVVDYQGGVYQGSVGGGKVGIGIGFWFQSYLGLAFSRKS